MVPASPGPPMTTILAGMAPTRPPGQAIPIAGARKTSTFVTEPLASHRAILKRRTKIILILMSQIRDLLWEMVTEPLFWPVMLVLAGTFACLEVTS